MPNRNDQSEILRRVGAVALFGLMLCFMLVMSWSGPSTVHAGGFAMVRADGTPPPQPDPTPTPQPPSGSVVTSIQKIIHNLKFDSSKISEALSKVFTAAAEDSESERQAELQTWTGVLSQLVEAPVANTYSTIARSSLKVAGSLAIALFILRLAMYQWNKMLGSEDSPLQVLGDWLTAGVLAVASGPFLDLIVRLGWWTMAAVLGETAGLAGTFIKSMASPTFVNSALLTLLTYHLLLGNCFRLLPTVQQTDGDGSLAHFGSFVLSYRLFDFCQFFRLEFIRGSHASSVSSLLISFERLLNFSFDFWLEVYILASRSYEELPQEYRFQPALMHTVK